MAIKVSAYSPCFPLQEILPSFFLKLFIMVEPLTLFTADTGKIIPIIPHQIFCTISAVPAHIRAGGMGVMSDDNLHLPCQVAFNDPIPIIEAFFFLHNHHLHNITSR